MIRPSDDRLLGLEGALSRPPGLQRGTGCLSRDQGNRGFSDLSQPLAVSKEPTGPEASPELLSGGQPSHEQPSKGKSLNARGPVAAELRSQWRGRGSLAARPRRCRPGPTSHGRTLPVPEHMAE